MKYAIFVLAALIAAPAAAFDLKPIPKVSEYQPITIVSVPATIQFRKDGLVPNASNIEFTPFTAYSDDGPALRFEQVCDEFGCRLEPVSSIIPPGIHANMDGGVSLLPRREHRVERRGGREGGFLRGLIDRLFGGRGERVAGRRDRRGHSGS